MKLHDVVDTLRTEPVDHGGYRVAILSRLSDSGEVCRQIKDFPISDIYVDHDDEEINLITTQLGDDAAAPTDSLSLLELLGRLAPLLDACATYDVFSRSAAMDLGEGYSGRLDQQLVGVATNTETGVFGFLQSPPEQWLQPP